MSTDVAAAVITSNVSIISSDDLETQSLLDKLDSLVGSNGCIRSAQEISKIVSIMRDVSSLINKCILLNVLQTTKANSTLTKLIDDGGWSVLNLWLSDAKKTGNAPLLIEIIQVLNKLPVTMSTLKQGNMGKLVKQLSKHDSAEVKKVAGEVLEKWMAIFRQGQAARSKTSLPSDSSASLASESQQDETKAKKAKKSKKEKELKSPVELQPPLGPLVALGKPRDKLKRPRDLNITSKNGGSVGDKKPKMSPPGVSTVEEDSDKNDKSQKGLVESSIFMNALSTQAAKWHEKRVKKIKAAGAKTAHSRTSSESGDNAAAIVPGGDNRTSKENLAQPETAADNNSSSSSSEPMDVTNSQESSEQQPMETEAPPTKPKKKVSWAPSDSLTDIQYFEVDESERVNRTRSFLDAAQKEKLMEREALSAGRAFDQLMEMIQWYRPSQYAEAISLVEKGNMSEQRKIQAEREQTVLGQLFLSKATVAPTPVEPDSEVETLQETKPKLIPLLEPGAVESHPPSNFFHGPGLIPGPIPGPVPGPGPNPGMMPPPIMGSGPPVPMDQHHKMMPGPPPQGSSKMYSPHPMDEPPHSHMPPPPGPSMMVGGGRGEQGNEWFGYGGGPPPNSRGFHSPNYGGGSEPFRGGGVRGRGGRGRGRGPRGGGQFSRFRNESGNQSNICKHFITHGCRLGNACKFLHVTPEELATNLHTYNNNEPMNRSEMH